jgi:hypothetical protein
MGASAAVRRRGVAGSDPAAVLAGGARPASKQGRWGTARWGPDIVTGGGI